MTVRPWMFAVAVCFVGVMSIGYLGATTYLVLRDNLIGATMARQARMQHEYEDRIAALRAQVDRVTSRQLLDQQVVEEKVEKLMEQQMALALRHGKIDALLDATNPAAKTPDEGPVPLVRPDTADQEASAPNASKSAFASLLGKPAEKPAPERLALGYAPITEGNVADRADRLFSHMTLSLKDIEREQMERITRLTLGASETASEISSILRRNGIHVDEQSDAVGGPYVAPSSALDFNASMNELDAALLRLEAMRDTARKLPFANPAPGQAITSRFGNRPDPFFGGLAMHAGLDFRAPTGTPILSTGAGTVITAGYSGGYGILVEIDHGHGLVTRYGHLSKAKVKKGDAITTGDLIGLSGSTGRSTGPHLHYEVRRNGDAIDPLQFINAGKKLERLVH
ncbi:M23 family metallopeptidase [Peteryoungia desertarenae]|uniref:M23 family metallopeptidase n=2 Tax=Peteryoungia desertarenae TaxID=1813451 RepID=A0ABX6QS29_9HYPH|nr:M23 family metallopeptidase [Peteryoungia desertarenae]